MPKTMFAKLITVIADKDHDGVVPQLQSVKRIEQYLDLGVNEAGARVVRGNDVARLSLRHRSVWRRIVDRGGQDLFAAAIRQANTIRWVHIEVFFRGCVGRVRPAKTGAEKKGLLCRNRLLDVSSCSPRHNSVGCLLVGSIQRRPTDRMADGTSRLTRLNDLVGRRLFA